MIVSPLVKTLHAATHEEQFNLLGQQKELQNNNQEDQYLATSIRDLHSQRNEYDPNWSHQVSFLPGNQCSQAASITEQRFGLLGQEEEIQDNSQEGQYLETSIGYPYSQRNEYEPNLPHQISLSRSKQHIQVVATTNQPFGLLGQQGDLQNNSQQGQWLATSIGDPFSQRNGHEPYWLCPRRYPRGNQGSHGAAIIDQQFDLYGQQEESQNNSQEAQYLVTSIREPHSQRNDNEANWAQAISFQQSNQRGQTLLGSTSNRAGSLISSQAADVTEQLPNQPWETSTGDCQNSGKFTEEDRQLLKEIQKKKRGAQISQEEEYRLEELLKKRKRMHDNNYRQRKKDILEEKDRIIQRMEQNIVAVEAANKELRLQLDERAKKEQSMESKMKELYNEAERLKAEIISLKSDCVSANERVQHFSLELEGLDNNYSDKQPNVTLPESLQTHCMEVAEIQNYQHDELEKRNWTGRKCRTSSTRERDTVDEESNSTPNFLHRLFSRLNYWKNKDWTR